MVKPVPPTDTDVKIKFGGGLHTRASADEIDPREASDGNNFSLDLQNRELRPRAPFDLIGQLPNQGSVLGGGSLLKSDGTVSTLIQAGGNVYSWDGSTGFTLVGTCNATSKLRGHWQRHNWTLADKVLFTDLSLLTVIKEWDGTTFASTSFTNQSGAAFGTFYAKYLNIANERAVWSNIKDGGGSFPHLIVGSATSTYTQITTSNIPASSLGVGDPFYMTIPDLKPINGHTEGFGTTVFSTEKGNLYYLTGTTAKDFAITPLFPGSGASGAESVTYIGNDVIYGRPGRIESVRDTSAFGNTEADDLTLEVADQIADYTGWTVAFNSRLNRVYLFPSGVGECWVFNTAMRTSRSLSANALDQFVFQNQPQKAAGQLSPWMRWTTTHALDFTPTMVMPLLDPADGLEYVFMGDSSGNLYRLEGTGTSGDGGTKSIDCSWTSKVFSAPLDSQVYNIEGYIKYKKNTAATVTLTLLAQGKTAFDKSITITLPAVSGGIYWGGSNYWGGNNYWGFPFQARLIRQYFALPGQINDFQIKVDVTGTNSFNINEIGLRLTAASQ